MIPYRFAAIFALPAALMAFASWRDKPVDQWTVEDAKQVLTDSPWARSVVPTTQQSNNSGGQGGRRGGRGIGINLPGVGFPGGGGMGGGRRGGGGQRRDDPDGGGRNRDYESPTLTVRWESASPIQNAVLKAKEEDSPTINEARYSIAIFGLPRSLDRDPRVTENKLKGQAQLKRNGKKFAKPVDVRLIVRDDKLIVVYTFDRKKEISKNDTDIQLDAHLGRYVVTQRFDPTEMIFDGKLAL